MKVFHITREIHAIDRSRHADIRKNYGNFQIVAFENLNYLSRTVGFNDGIFWGYGRRLRSLKSATIYFTDISPNCTAMS